MVDPLRPGKQWPLFAEHLKDGPASADSQGGEGSADAPGETRADVPGAALLHANLVNLAWCLRLNILTANPRAFIPNLLVSLRSPRLASVGEPSLLAQPILTLRAGGDVALAARRSRPTPDDTVRAPDEVDSEWDVIGEDEAAPPTGLEPSGSAGDGVQQWVMSLYPK